eukprot:859641-Rhodomonas_salina.1
MGGTAAESGSVEAANRGAVRTRQACGEMRLISDAPSPLVQSAQNRWRNALDFAAHVQVPQTWAIGSGREVGGGHVVVSDIELLVGVYVRTGQLIASLQGNTVAFSTMSVPCKSI